MENDSFVGGEKMVVNLGEVKLQRHIIFLLQEGEVVKVWKLYMAVRRTLISLSNFQ